MLTEEVAMSLLIEFYSIRPKHQTTLFYKKESVSNSETSYCVWNPATRLKTELYHIDGWKPGIKWLKSAKD